MRWMERQKPKAKDIVAVNTVVTEPNSPLAYDPGSKRHRSTIRLPGGACRLVRERDREREIVVDKLDIL